MASANPNSAGYLLNQKSKSNDRYVPRTPLFYREYVFCKLSSNRVDDALLITGYFMADLLVFLYPSKSKMAWHTYWAARFRVTWRLLSR